MLLQAARELNLDLARSFMIGDKVSDVEAGRRAGCRTIFLAGLYGAPAEDAPPDGLAASWPEVVDAVEALMKKQC